MKRKTAFFGVASVLLLLVLAGILLMPYFRAERAMPADSRLTLECREDGSRLLRWPRADGADGYLVEILPLPESGKTDPLHTEIIRGSEELMLPPLPAEALVFRICPMGDYRILGTEQSRTGEPLEVRVNPEPPQIMGLSWITDSEESAVTASFQMIPGDICRVYRVGPEGSRKLLQTLTENTCTVRFGHEIPLPEWGETCRIEFDAYREAPGMTLFGPAGTGFSLERQDLLGETLNARFEQAGHRAFRVTWEETRGDWYEVRQILEDGSTKTLCRISREAERCFTSEMLENGREYAFQVAAMGGLNPENCFVAAASQVYRTRTEPSAIYATVWPIRDLKAYADPSMTSVVASVEKGQAYCVAAEEAGAFGVRIGDRICYIDSRCCMINLPDYLGGLCAYEITNSTESRMMIHEFEIPDVTGRVIPGYEDVAREDGSYLVPLLYPTAKMLRKAAETAISQGYRLKIYDAFRPQQATKAMFDRTEEILGWQIPRETYTGVSRELLNLPRPDGDGVLTYRRVMTNGIYSQNHFLAEGMSRHNLGLALDLTLEDCRTGEELRMQSSIDDLSWYSVTTENNENAELLESVMKGAGFAGLSTEWWHFQDDITPRTVSLNALWEGVSSEGWSCDNRGWRYRDGKGSFYRNQTLLLDGKEYAFDENGYEIGFLAGVG